MLRPLRHSVAALALAACGALALSASCAAVEPERPAAGEPPPSERPAGLRIPDQLEAPVEATVFSFPTDYFYPGEVVHFLRRVRTLAPERDLVVLADPAMRRGIAEAAEGLDLTLIDTGDHLLSPWPRDPFSVGVDGAGRTVLIDRPNRQRTREGDSEMARILAEGLPDDLARAWGGVRRWRAPIPFHNGHMLSAGGDLWMSLHSLEPRILEILGTDRIPVASFGTAEGIERYLRAADRAAADFEALYGRGVRLVHPLPRSGEVAERRALLERIGGGAGFDLDSLVTLLPGPDGRLRALVGSLEEGRRLLSGLGAGDWAELIATYGLESPPEELSAEILAYQRTRRAAGLEGFLDLVAGHLEASGLAVDRLPLLLVPLGLVPGTQGLLHRDFVLSWNNVVPERRADGTRAVGFAAGLPAGDRLALDAFARAGVPLELLPPLPSSIINNGGYRCASNQVRRPGAR